MNGIRSVRKAVFRKLLNMVLDLVSETATGSLLWKKGVLKNFAKFTGKHLICATVFFK